MRITFDPAKRDKTLIERGLDFAEAAEVFDGPVYEIEDTHKPYGEKRILCFGLYKGRLVVVGYVQRGTARHVFTMRKANEKEQTKFRKRLS
jgi:uncharacterized DUF497 family protein